MSDGLCGYVAFYKGKRIELRAKDMLAAKRKAAELFGVSERDGRKYRAISVVLAERADGSPVVHTPDF